MVDDFEILREFAQLLGITLPLKPKSIFAQLSTQLAEYQGMDYQNLVAGGRKRAQSASGGKKAEVLD